MAFGCLFVIGQFADGFSDTCFCCQSSGWFSDGYLLLSKLAYFCDYISGWFFGCIFLLIKLVDGFSDAYFVFSKLADGFLDA